MSPCHRENDLVSGPAELVSLPGLLKEKAGLRRARSILTPPRLLQQQLWIRLMLLSGFPRAPQDGLLNVQLWEPLGGFRAPEGSEEELSWQNLLFYPWILLF